MIPPDSVLPSDEWMATDVTITCPHGHRREHDGEFNDCECTNPLKSQGLI